MQRSQAWTKGSPRTRASPTCLTIFSKACWFLISPVRFPAVKERVIQITTTQARRTVVTAESLLDEAEEVRKAAYDNKQFSAANNAIKTKSVPSGHWIERAEIGSPGEFDHMSDVELERAIVERFIQLGFAKKLAIGNGSIARSGDDRD